MRLDRRRRLQDCGIRDQGAELHNPEDATHLSTSYAQLESVKLGTPM